MMFKVSQTKIKTWRRCRQAYHYKFFEALEAKKKSRPLTFGTLIHKMLERHGNGGDPFVVIEAYRQDKKFIRLFREEREMYGNILLDATIIMQEYFAHWDKKSIEYLEYNGQKTEHEIEVPIHKNILFKGKVDAFIKANKLRWLVEHKTFKQMPNDDDRWRAIQSAIYTRAMELIGFKLDGTLWNYIRSKPPTAPQVLKSGSISSRQLDSLPTKILLILKELNFDPKDYQKLLKTAELNRYKYFKRIFNPNQKAVVDQITNDFVETSLELAELHGYSQTKTIDRHCSWCEFEPLCRAQMLGHDVDAIKENEYVRDESKLDNEEDDDDDT